MCYQHPIEIPLSPTQNKSITYSSQQLRDINNNVKKNKLYLRLNPVTIKKGRDYRIKRQRVTRSTRHEHRPRSINTQNLITVRTIDFRGKVTIPYNCYPKCQVSQKQGSTSISKAHRQQYRYRTNHRSMAEGYTRG